MGHPEIRRSQRIQGDNEWGRPDFELCAPFSGTGRRTTMAHHQSGPIRMAARVH